MREIEEMAFQFLADYLACEEAEEWLVKRARKWCGDIPEFHG